MKNDLIERLLKVRCLDCQALPYHGCTGGHDGKIMNGFHLSRIVTAMQGEVGEPTEAKIDLAERAIEEWITAHDGEEIECRALARIAALAASPPVDQGRMTKSKRHKFQMSLATTCEHCIHCGAIAGVGITADGKLSGTMNEDCPALTNKGANP